MRRHAFTLVEVLVAIVVFSVGILGMAAMGTFLVTQVREAGAFTHAATLSATVLDSLRASPCSAVSGGTSTRGAAALRWTASPTGPVVAVTAIVTIAGRRVPFQYTFDALLPCER